MEYKLITVRKEGNGTNIEREKILERPLPLPKINYS